MRLLGFVILAAFAVGMANDHPQPALHGQGLAVTIALVVYLGSLITGFLIGVVLFGMRGRLHQPSWQRAIPVFLLAASSATLFGLQHKGYGIAGIYTASSIAGLRYRGRLGYALLVAALVSFDVAAFVGHKDHGVLNVLSNDGGVAMLFFITRLTGRTRDDKERAEGLLVELEESRDAQARAAALSERGRIAREMHDVLAHSLSALAVQLEGARLLARDRHADADVVEAIEKAHHLAGGGLEEARRTIEALRGDDLPGPGRLAALAEAFGEQAGVETSFDVAGDARELSSEARLALYRTAQEALTNVRKHARAERVDLRLRYGTEGTSLVVEDHGANGSVRNGSPLAATGGGYGLSGMRERAELLGGRLLATPTDHGFRVELWLPT
jgi:signal transduction histidine kinase